MQRGRSNNPARSGVYSSAVKSRRAPAPPPRSFRTPMAGLSSRDLSMVAQYDELMRNGSVLHEGGEDKFAVFVSKANVWLKRWRESEINREQAAKLIREKDSELKARDYKIKQARKIVEDERKGRLQAEAERDSFAKQLNMLKDILLSENGRGFDNETLERVRHIDTTVRKLSPHKQQDYRLTAVEESVESLLDISDMSFDETRDDLGDSRVNHKANYSKNAKRRSSAGAAERAQKRRKSRNSMGAILDGDKILSSTTKVTVDGHGNAHAESIIEALPVADADLRKKARKSRDSRGGLEGRVTYNDHDFQQEFSPSAPPCPSDMAARGADACWKNAKNGGFTTPTNNYNNYHNGGSSPHIKRHLSNAGSIPNRPHNWIKGRFTVSGCNCGICEKKIKFPYNYEKCTSCAMVVGTGTTHSACKAQVPFLCVPVGNRTPTNKPNGMYLADYAPLDPPMVPALLRHCVKEVEERGLEEVGIYRIPGNEAEANEVLEKFRRGKGAPVLSKYEIHVVASVVKKFLRSLKEPVIPNSLWKVFVDAANNPDSTDAESSIYQAVSELPRPNRDSLAFLILHLQKVAESPYCKMDIDNLSKIWGPTVVGHSSSEPMALMSEAGLVAQVMRTMLRVNSDYWDGFLQYQPKKLFPDLHTPEERSDRMFVPASAYKSGGPVAKGTRSKHFARQQQYFQSPMLK